MTFFHLSVQSASDNDQNPMPTKTVCRLQSEQSASVMLNFRVVCLKTHLLSSSLVPGNHRDSSDLQVQRCMISAKDTA